MGQKKQEIADFHLRLPAGIFKLAVDRAWQNRRSINAELVFLVSKSLGVKKGG